MMAGWVFISSPLFLPLFNNTYIHLHQSASDKYEKIIYYPLLCNKHALRFFSGKGAQSLYPG
jgi:hypothetical protein